mmetsp:Transcript_79691/g.133106  ORF Transcript_79691/g.133106 Transcript_79691/m.133106 type:complete len:247 (+) Transcript_79691:448-1188(+)
MSGPVAHTSGLPICLQVISIAFSGRVTTTTMQMTSRWSTISTTTTMMRVTSGWSTVATITTVKAATARSSFSRERFSVHFKVLRRRSKGISICYSGFSVKLPSWLTRTARRDVHLPTCVTRRRLGLLQIPLWNYVFLVQIAKIAKKTSFGLFTARAWHKGILWVADCVTDTGQINTGIIPQIPQAYREMYVHRLILYIDATAGREAVPWWPWMPRVAEWKMCSMLHACRQQPVTEERQPAPPHIGG